MNGKHLVPLRSVDTVFSPDWALSMICSVYDHILYGPEVLLVRSNSLNAVMAARARVLGEMPKARRNKENGRWLKC